MYEKKARDYDEVLMKKEQQIKELEQQLSKTHSTDSVKLEHAIKKLQASLGEFRGEISVYRVSTVRNINILVVSIVFIYVWLNRRVVTNVCQKNNWRILVI